MQNAYLIDTFLSATAWVMLVYVYFELLDKMPKLSRAVNKTVFAIAIGEYAKPALLIAMPFVGILLFCLWRFYGLMIATQAWGAGGVGLLVIMAVLGMAMIALNALITLVLHSCYVDATAIIDDTKKSMSKLTSSKLPPPNTPLNQVRA